MDDKKKMIMDSIENHRLTADSVFMFHCTMCGDCCRNRDDILLTPKDLFNLAKGLKMKPEDVVEKYGETFLGSSSRMPLARLKSTGFDRHCVFLENNCCAVQAFKPTVCAMFPIGRFVEKGKGEQIQYMFTNPNCGDKHEFHTVREWLGNYGIPIDDEFYKKWTATVGTLSDLLSKLEKHSTESAMENLWTLVYIVLYLEYDTEKDFMPQFINNSERITESVKKLYDNFAGGH